MNKQEKRRLLKRALNWLNQIFTDPENQPPQWASIMDALAKDTIVVLADIEHRSIMGDITVVTCKGRTLKTMWGHHSKEGPALAIILPLPEEASNDQTIS